MESNMIITKDEVRKFRQSIPERQSAGWSDIEIEDCLRMYKDGESITAIAMKHKRSGLAIQKKLDDLGACNASKRRRRENRVKCKCKDCELYLIKACAGGMECINRGADGYTLTDS